MNLLDSLGRRSVPRKSHRKSRGGCRSCKQRRIKCDESRPTCAQCLARRISCEYAFNSGDQINPESNSSANRVEEFTAQDFALYHHFITTTVHCFETDEYQPQQGPKFWREALLKFAFDNRFLLHLILALAAQHKASISPEEAPRAWKVEAERHYVAALPSIIDGIPTIDASSSSSLYIASILICLYHLSKGPMPGEYLAFSSKGQAEPEWMSLFRGIKALESASAPGDGRASARPAPQRTPTTPDDSNADTAYRDSLLSLRQLLVSTADEVADGDCNIKALDKLLPVLDAQFDPNFQSSEATQHAHIAFSWLYTVPDKYIAKLQDRDPAALVIFAYFAARLKGKEQEQPWPLKGWSSHVMNGVEENISAEWDQWLQWPRHRFIS